MQRRIIRQLAIGTAFVASLGLAGQAVHADHEIKIGVVGPKTGPMAAGAAVTHWTAYRLWQKEVNARGGFLINGKRHKMKLIEYDDRTNPGETIKAVNRLATQDKADLIMAPYGTGFNLASAPVFHKHGYPQFAIAAVSDQVEKMVKKFSTIFFFLGYTTSYAESVAEIMAKMRDAGKINNRVAMVNVGDTFGIELANAARPVFKKLGFKIVYDKSYPLGTQDLTPVIKAAKAAKPDSFVAWSYPPDTFGLAKQAKTEGLNVKVYYSAVATAFPGFYKVYGKSAENILGAGGTEITPAFVDYLKRHKAATGVDGDYWGTALYGALTQALTESIEAVGADKTKILNYIKSRTFKTIVGTLDLRSQKMPVWWTVGQWQNGKFVGVKGYGTSGEKAAKIKKGW
ncbi:MAG: amino acid ABC transporter substrate-binding protein [Pseudomonadota bacterium]|nr:amino acid ABC transporter substrate-binding protein [Pseudomonadota bacterium]